jgi:hypothetical protein
MENYGFTVITKEEASSIGLPNGTGLFDELYKSMESEISRNSRIKSEYESAPNMSNEEKRISFLNRYFVFRKTHNVNAEKAAKLMMRRSADDEEADEIINRVQKEDEKLADTQMNKISVIRKLPGKKVKLVIGRVDNTTIDDSTINMIEPTVAAPKKVVIRRPKPPT